MKHIPFFHRMLTLTVLATALMTAGCGESPDMRDQRLVDYARDSMTEQRKQNDRIADQAKAVVEESSQLATAAKELVQSDAEARRELIAAQTELNSQLNDQRANVDAGRSQLEMERQQIAQQRIRDPMIAAAIQNTGLIIACLLPLVVCIFVIRQMKTQEPDHAAVAELLVSEMTSIRPILLPSPSRRSVGIDHDDTGEPPF